MKTLIVFAKVPERGKVKTRLQKSTPLTKGEVERLYEAFLKDVLISSWKTKSDRILVGCHPGELGKRMEEIFRGLNLAGAGGDRFQVFAQRGDRFDNRIQYAYHYAKRKNGSGPIVLIGSDSPHLQPAQIDRAFRFLERRGGAAIGPSGEGGMYLIGFHSDLIPDVGNVFTNGNEMDNLLNQVAAHRLPLLLLEEMTDVDVESDLITLIGLLRAMRISARHRRTLLPRYTMETIEDLGLFVARPGDGTRGKRIGRKR